MIIYFFIKYRLLHTYMHQQGHTVWWLLAKLRFT